MTGIRVYRAPLRSRRDDVSVADAVERALSTGVCGVGGIVDPPPRTLAEAVSRVAGVHDERTARRLERFAAARDGSWVWTRDPEGLWWLGRLIGPWRYDAAAPAVAVDLVHVRDCRWSDDPVPDAAVPAGVRHSFARGGRFVASLATALFAIACGLAVTQLMQTRRERRADATSARNGGPRFLATLPTADALESLAYRFVIVGFVFWTFTLIAGAIWANDSWGRYWGFDTKEVWTFVIWVLYAGYIHARATRGWRGTRSAWLCITGFATVLFNFTVVNMFFKGLHAYSGLS